MRRGTPWFVAAVLLLLLACGLGLRSGLGEWSRAGNPARRLATLTELGYSLTALLATAALWVGHRRTMPLAVTWAVLITVTGGLAPVVWGGAPLYTGVLAGFVTAAVAGLGLWLVRRALATPRAGAP